MISKENLFLAQVILNGLIAGIEMKSEIPISLLELQLLQKLIGAPK
jgi:hypothetical protein